MRLSQQGTIRRVAPAILLACAIVPYFVGLGDSSIWDANEAFYVQTPREMMARGDYVFPTFNDEPRLNKPVLSYWIVAGFYHAFGISVAVQRLAIALGAMGMAAAAFFLARAAAPRTPGWPDAALWAALAFVIAPRVVMFARRIFIDVYISMFMAMTLLFFACSERYPARRRLFLVLMYVAVGLGVLTKGPIAALLPGLVFAVYLIAHRELGRVREMMIPAGVLIVLAIVVPWYAALYARDGWTYIVSFFLGENIGRYAVGVGAEQDRGPFFYLPVLFSDVFPLSLFLPAAAAAWWAGRRQSRPAAPERRVQTLLWLWIVLIVVFFSFSHDKQDLYIFPVAPAIAALAGLYLSRAVAEGGTGRGLLATTIAAGALLALLGSGVLYLFRAAGSVYQLDGAVPMGALALAGGIATVALAILRRGQAALLAAVLATIGVNWVFVTVALPGFERYKPVPPLARAIADRAGPDAMVAVFDEALPSLVYYVGRPVDVFLDADPLVDALRSRREVYAVIAEDSYAGLDPETRGRTCTVARHPTFDVKLRNVLAREPLPELLVVTNRCP